MEWRGSVRRSPQLFNLVWPWAQPNTEAPPPPHTLRVSVCQLLYWRKRGRHCGTDLAWCWSLGERREGGRQGGTFVLESLTGRENLCERRVCVKREGGRGGVTICECETSNCWTSHWTLFWCKSSYILLRAVVSNPPLSSSLERYRKKYRFLLFILKTEILI